MLGVFIGALDNNIIAPAFSLISRSFHVPMTWVAWTITAYTVAYVAATSLAGAAGDRFGRKRLFLLGIILFGAASALAAFAHVFWLFLCARALQGIGAGAVYPNAQAEGVAQFPQERRGMALGLFGAVFGVASIIGPNAGGALAQYFGWQWIFLINIPIAVLVLLLSIGVSETSRQEHALPDVAGSIAFATFLATILLTLAIDTPLRWAFLAGALLSFAGFRWRQSVAATPFLDTGPLRGAQGIALISGAALIGLDMSAAVFVPLLAQSILHFSVFASGVALMPAALSGAIFAGLGGMLTDRSGARLVLVIGLVAAVFGAMLLAWPGLTFLRFVIAMVLLGIGTAFTMGAPLNHLAIHLYGEESASQALSLVAVFRSIGLAAGPVLLTLAQAWRGFSAMFSAVALASLIGALLFATIPIRREIPQPTRQHS
ncbi:MAG: MFS transporter [Firmicutes bacterium]|nr:MFS transporter [Bacillota bacterium]